MHADMFITVLVSFNRFLTIVFSNGDMVCDGAKSKISNLDMEKSVSIWFANSLLVATRFYMGYLVKQCCHMYHRKLWKSLYLHKSAQ